MIQEIENRRSIRKYKADKINKELIEDIIYSATLAPCLPKTGSLGSLLYIKAKKRRNWLMLCARV